MRTHHNSTSANVTDTVTHKTLPMLASYGLPVAGEYRIETRKLDGQKVPVVVAQWKVPASDDCWPVYEAHLAEDFARITNEVSLQEFNSRYGLLGYHRLNESEMLRRDETWHGDPVPWALAHARVAAGILDVTAIINDVRAAKKKLDRNSLIGLLRALLCEFGKMGLERVFAVGPSRRWEGFTWTTPESFVSRTKFQLQKRFGSNWGSDPIGTAYYVLAWIINQYIRHVRFEFISLDYFARGFGMTESVPRFGPELRWDAMIQVIYWQLAEQVGGAFQRCLRCGLIFPMRSGKDKYCSPRCSDAMRSKKYRASHPGGKGSKGKKPRRKRSRKSTR